MEPCAESRAEFGDTLERHVDMSKTPDSFLVEFPSFKYLVLTGG